MRAAFRSPPRFAAAALALIGALALACFVKALGATFLGQPRSLEARRGARGAGQHARPDGACSRSPARSSASARRWWRRCSIAPPGAWAPEFATALAPATSLAPLLIVTALCGVLVLALRRLGDVARRAHAAASTGAAEPRVGTWDCGYAAPTRAHAVHVVVVCAGAREPLRLGAHRCRGTLPGNVPGSLHPSTPSPARSFPGGTGQQG